MSGYVRKRLKSKVLRFRHYGLEEDPDNYYREQLMLFTSWRDEETELLSVNWARTYNEKQEIIRTNARKFFHNLDIDDNILEKIIHDTENDVLNEEDNNVLDNNLRLMESDDFFEPDIEESVVSKSPRFDQFLPPRLICQEEYLKIMRSLNEKQERFVLNVLHLYKTSPSPFYFFLSGGAGVGKSHAITAIVQSILRFSAGIPTSQPEEVAVIVCAPTGKAAFNVFGMTMHCAFNLIPNQGKVFCDLDSARLNTLRVRFDKVKLIIIDEISMVSVRQLYQIDHRLRQIFATTEYFGGKSVIACGHLRQLPPVGGKYVFSVPDVPLVVCVGNVLWELFTLFELDEVMRQKGDAKFC